MFRTMSWCLILVGVVAASTQAVPISVWMSVTPEHQTVGVGDTVSIDIFAWSNGELDFNSAQAVLTWDPGYLQLTDCINPGLAMWNPLFRANDSFGLNESSMPQDGDALWIGEVDPGQTLPIDSSGLTLATLTFTALAETDETPVDLLSEFTLEGKPTARSKFNSGTYNVLDTSNLPSTSLVTIVPEPASMLLLLVGGLAIARRK